jgi:hypothetical protein
MLFAMSDLGYIKALIIVILIPIIDEFNVECSSSKKKPVALFYRASVFEINLEISYDFLLVIEDGHLIGTQSIESEFDSAEERHPSICIAALVIGCVCPALDCARLV